MARLHWIRAENRQQIPARTRLPEGYEVHMEGRHYAAAPPKEFDLYHVYSPVVATIMRVRKRYPGVHYDGDTWDATQIDSTTSITDALPLRASRFTGSHRWKFTDRTLWSPVVRTVRFMDLSIRGKAGTPRDFPVNAELEVKVTVPIAGENAKADLSVVLPRGELSANPPGGALTNEPAPGEVTVQDLVLMEVHDDFDWVSDGSEEDEEILGALDSLLPVESPVGWAFDIDSGTLEVGPGTSQTASLRINAAEPGAIALAVRADDRSSDTAPTFSDIVIVELRGDGTMALLYGDENDVGEVAG